MFTAPGIHDTDNAYDPCAFGHEFNGPADDDPYYTTDDSEDYEHSCGICGEPTASVKLSKHTPGVCRFCCPIHRAEYAAQD